MEVSEKAWQAFQKAKKMLWTSSMLDVDVMLRKHAMSQETQEALRKELPPQQYANYLSWEALDTMGGLLELLIAIQTMKNDGTITVQWNERDYTRSPLSNSGTEHPDDREDIHQTDDTAICHPDSAGA